MIASEQITLDMAMAQLTVARLAREVTNSCLQYYGDIGQKETRPAHTLRRDAPEAGQV